MSLEVINLFISRYNHFRVFFFVTEMAITNSIVYEVVLNSCVLRSNIFVTFVFRHQ